MELLFITISIIFYIIGYWAGKAEQQKKCLKMIADRREKVANACFKHGYEKGYAKRMQEERSSGFGDAPLLKN